VIFLLLHRHVGHQLHLLLHRVGHQLLLGTLGADNVLTVRYKAFAHHGCLAGGAHETIIVPVAAFERDETGAANSCDGFCTGGTTL